ncbi:RNA polymerase II-associated protein 3 [Biomphalaria pfeifferi]|uniref:RNA polymerase II-associated protein 3 n=1 Tax=Biomphalaria pfeifferi TaxID=112525 RepID=A0AAD8F1T9_BIOPF|nr:RNA polymerase II-associated protein 3 [Biomphalaria pfeifferi]
MTTMAMEKVPQLILSCHQLFSVLKLKALPTDRNDRGCTVIRSLLNVKMALLSPNTLTLNAKELLAADNKNEKDSDGILLQQMFDASIYGQHETQIFEAGEINLHKHFKHCTKNPKHENFIPVDKFSLENLPDDCRDEELYDCV